MQVRLPVHDKFPARISRIPEISYNLWWSWRTQAREMFRRLDLELWRKTAHNPVRMVNELDPETLQRLAENPQFVALYDSVTQAFDHYMAHSRSWFNTNHPEHQEHLIAYFCAEFGIHNSLPIYSGGLGILAGDTCKEASDLGLPFVAIGSLYPEGYFRQRIEPGGRQSEDYIRLDTSNAPLLPVLDDGGGRLLIEVRLGNSQVQIALWKIQVGRVPIFLMDTDIEENEPWQRDVSARLYSGDQLVRLRQEIILGIGGVRALKTLGYHPTTFHLNEGHAAFATLQLLRGLRKKGLPFQECLQSVRDSVAFTTHTPVEAGHDEFPFHLMEEYFAPVWDELGISREQFLQLGQPPGRNSFSMTVLALRTAGRCNGVSKRHGEVSRQMWNFLWPEKAEDEVPIQSITNGIHVPTWLSSELSRHFKREFGPHWAESHDDPAAWEGIASIPEADLWAAHLTLKSKLMNFLREQTRKKWLSEGASSEQLVGLGCFLNPNYLTIGFARRFATYKRATLILRDLERLKSILMHSKMPVQLIFAGKAHPADEAGKWFLQQIFEAGSSHQLNGHITVAENYNMHVGHFMIAGVDVWLNNPSPPLEASGTSGQKAALNGVPNLSVLDGWWSEGFNGSNGWAIGGEDDDATAQSIYDLLENEIVPTFYDRDPRGIPLGWVSLMREAIRSAAAPFSARRMVKEYCSQMYVTSRGILEPSLATGGPGTKPTLDGEW